MLRAMSSPSAAVLLDPAAVYPEFTALRAALQRQDWPAARAVLDAAPPAMRTGLIATGGAELPGEALLLGVLANDPADGAAAAMLGYHYVDVGWSIRTGARAKNVSQEQFAKFRVWLCKAEAVLIEGAARSPGDPAIWTERLPAGRGLEVGLSEIQRRYDRVAAADPHHLPAQTQMLQSLCPKWSGTWEQAYAFARDAMLAAPPGAAQATLVAEYHIERCLEDAGGDLAAWQRYLSGREVHAELYEAAERSVWHPEFRHEYGWVAAASSLAMAFSVAADDAAAARMFRLLGDFGTKGPWQYLGDPAEQIRQHRARALRAGGER